MLRLIVCITTLFILASCQRDFNPLDDTEPADERCRITKIIQGIHNGAADDTTTLFFYNSAGKIERINESQGGSSYDLFLEYDVEGRLVKYDDHLTSPIDTAVYVYNSKGQLTTIFYNIAAQDKIHFEYEPSSDLPVGMNFGAHDAVHFKYHYKDGNIISREAIINGVSKGLETFEYTDIPNQLGIMNLLGFTNGLKLGFQQLEFLFFNKNMIKVAKEEPGGKAYFFSNYKTDSEGRVTAYYHDFYRMPDTTFQPFDSRYFFWECK